MQATLCAVGTLHGTSREEMLASSQPSALRLCRPVPSKNSSLDAPSPSIENLPRLGQKHELFARGLFGGMSRRAVNLPATNCHHRRLAHVCWSQDCVSGPITSNSQLLLPNDQSLNLARSFHPSDRFSMPTRTFGTGRSAAMSVILRMPHHRATL